MKSKQPTRDQISQELESLLEYRSALSDSIEIDEIESMSQVEIENRLRDQDVVTLDDSLAARQENCGNESKTLGLVGKRQATKNTKIRIEPKPINKPSPQTVDIQNMTTRQFQILVGSKIRKHRKEEGIPLKLLAERIGLSQGHLISLELGFEYIQIRVLRKIAIAIGVRLDVLMSGESNSIEPKSSARRSCRNSID